jgi:hypothetical protein
MVVPTRASGANRCARPKAGRHQSFVFQTLERRVDSTGGDITFESRLYFLQDRAAVGPVVKPDDREKHGLFERAQHVSH